MIPERKAPCVRCGHPTVRPRLCWQCEEGNADHRAARARKACLCGCGLTRLDGERRTMAGIAHPARAAS